MICHAMIICCFNLSCMWKTGSRHDLQGQQADKYNFKGTDKSTRSMNKSTSTIENMCTISVITFHSNLHNSSEPEKKSCVPNCCIDYQCL